MTKNQKIILVVVGLFIVAILVNMVMNREYFGSSTSGNPTNMTQNPGMGGTGGDATGNVFSQLVHQLLGQTPSSTDLGVGTTYSNTNLLGASTPSDASGNTLHGSGSTLDASGNPLDASESTLDASGSPLDASGSTIDWKGDIDQIKNILKGMVLSTKDTQNCNATSYSLDETAQQPCATGTAGTAGTTGTTTPQPTPSLQQGMDYSGCGVQENSCPYGQGQQLAKKAKPYPIDMNDYIRKDSIPCYGCNIK